MAEMFVINAASLDPDAVSVRPGAVIVGARRVGADASPIRQLEELSADLEALHSTQERREELFKHWREHFAAWEWATRSLAAKVNALPVCRAPGSHAPDCECATL